MKKFLLIIFAVSIFSAMAGPAKMIPPPQVCITFDTSDTMLTYEVGGATREQFLQSFTKRVNRYLVKNMEEEKIAVNKSMCNAEADATLTVTLDTLGAISSRKLLIGSSRTHAKLNFLVKLISPKGTVLLDEEHDVDQEKLDDLADKTASVINKKVRPFF